MHQRPLSANVRLSTQFYSYKTPKGQNSHFAVSQMAPVSQSLYINKTRPSSAAANKTLLTQISKHLSLSEEPDIHSRKKSTEFYQKDRKKIQRLNQKHKLQQRDTSNQYVQFNVLIKTIQFYKLNQSQQSQNCQRFYQRSQVFELREEKLKADRYNSMIEEEEDSVMMPMAEKMRQQMRGRSQFVPKSSIDGATRERFRMLLGSLDRKDQEFKRIRDGVDRSKNVKEILNSVIQGDESIDEKMQRIVRRYIQRKDTMLGDIMNSNQELKSMISELEIKDGQANQQGSPQVWHIKRDLIKRASSIYKQNSPVPIRQGSISQFNSPLGEPQQEGVERRRFIMQLLSVEETVKQRSELDRELEKERNVYWKLDGKGRSIREMEQRRQRNRVRRYGVIFSRSVRGKFDRMRELLIQCVRKLKVMKITCDELMSDRVILRKPYQREGSYVFFKAVEKGDYEMVQLCISKCRYFAFDVDHNLQSGLHICARRGNVEIGKLLLEQGAYGDAVDVSGKTALYYAVHNGNINMIRLLLYNQVNPWSFSKCEYQRATNNTEILRLLKIARRLNILLMMTAYRHRQVVWLEYRELFIRQYTNQQS